MIGIYTLINLTLRKTTLFINIKFIGKTLICFVDIYMHIINLTIYQSDY